MKYRVTVSAPEERETRIRRSLESSETSEEFYDFRGTKTALPVVRIPIDLPIYRMANFRTFSAQAEYISREGKPADFFLHGQENESVQQIQHEILAKLAAKGKASSVIPVIDVLEREGQRETLLITRGGLVVNGNRRLAAMRELYAGDSGTFSSFSFVNCKVLPADTTTDEILEIEGILQAKPETRLDYDWIGDAQLLRAMLKVKGSVEEVAKMLGRRVAEVKNALQALAQADLYLKEWAKAEGEYSRVIDDGEQFFKDLPALVEGHPPGLREASRAIAWAMFENKDMFEGRIYNYKVVIGKRASDALDRLSDQLGVPVEETETADEDTFEFDLGQDEREPSYDALIATLRDPDSRARAIEALVDVSISIVESEKDKQAGNAALRAITAANAKLAEVDLARAAPDTLESIEHQLAAIGERSSSLLKQVRLLKAESAA